MKLCMDHWGRLRAAISERGLDHLVAKDGAAAFRRAKADVEGDGLTLTTFDPLMSANYAIWGRAMDMAGLAVMAPNDDGTERCPICWLSQEHDAHCTLDGCELPKDGTAFDRWIEFAANDAKATADRLLADA